MSGHLMTNKKKKDLLKCLNKEERRSMNKYFITALTALLLSQSGTTNAKLYPTCVADEFLGKVYYAPVITSDGPVCVKFDLSSIGGAGSIETDWGSVDCANSFISDTTYGTLSSTSGNIVTFSPDLGGWSGQLLIVEDDSIVDGLQMSLETFLPSSKTYVVQLRFPSCFSPSMSPTAPPTPIPTCPLDEFIGISYIFPLLTVGGLCVKLDFFEGRTASIEPTNTNCESPYKEDHIMENHHIQS